MMNYSIQSLLRPNPPLLPPPTAEVGDTGEPSSEHDPCVRVADAEILSDGESRAATASPRVDGAMDDIHQERSDDHAGSGYVMPPEDQFVTDNDVSMVDQRRQTRLGEVFGDKSNSEQIDILQEMVAE